MRVAQCHQEFSVDVWCTWNMSYSWMQYICGAEVVLGLGCHSVTLTDLVTPRSLRLCRQRAKRPVLLPYGSCDLTTWQGCAMHGTQPCVILVRACRDLQAACRHRSCALRKIAVDTSWCLSRVDAMWQGATFGVMEIPRREQI